MEFLYVTFKEHYNIVQYENGFKSKLCFVSLYLVDKKADMKNN